MHPRCLPGAYWMPPRCLQDASQMRARCLPDACQMLPRCFPRHPNSSLIAPWPQALPNGFQMLPKKLCLGSHVGVIRNKYYFLKFGMSKIEKVGTCVFQHFRKFGTWSLDHLNLCNLETLKFFNLDILKFWNVGSWNLETLKFWNFWIE